MLNVKTVENNAIYLNDDFKTTGSQFNMAFSFRFRGNIQYTEYLYRIHDKYH